MLYGVYDKFFSQGAQLKKELIDNYKNRIDQLEGQKTESENKAVLSEAKAHTESLKVAARDATIIEKDKQLEGQKVSLAFRNPDVLEVIKETRDLYKKLLEFMATIFDYIKKTNEELKYQTELLEESKKRDKQVDDELKNGN